ncbi:MAG: hypothetical protein RR775_13480 [Massilia sp.]|uniref:hypothetical protein n=1 Tax=Massilia sp. TaxID=1882437 RepID=UPI002FCBDB07
MPHIAVDVNNVRITTINLASTRLMNVSVHGALDRTLKAAVDAMGGNYDEGSCGHLTWLIDHPVQLGDIVRVHLNQGDANGDAGKTFEELFPDEPPSTQTDFSISDTMAAEIRARPRRHAAFEVQASTSAGQQATATSNERDTDFRFSVLWDHFQPDEARIHLATYCLDHVLARMAGTTHLQTTIRAGETATFSLVA